MQCADLPFEQRRSELGRSIRIGVRPRDLGCSRKLRRGAAFRHGAHGELLSCPQHTFAPRGLRIAMTHLAELGFWHRQARTQKNQSRFSQIDHDFWLSSMSRLARWRYTLGPATVGACFRSVASRRKSSPRNTKPAMLPAKRDLTHILAQGASLQCMLEAVIMSHPPPPPPPPRGPARAARPPRLLGGGPPPPPPPPPRPRGDPPNRPLHSAGSTCAEVQGGVLL